MKEDYKKFDEAKTGFPIPESVRIVEADYFLFSIYTVAPKDIIDVYGIVYFGFMGNFLKVTDGQYDNSIWEDFLK